MVLAKASDWFHRPVQRSDNSELRRNFKRAVQTQINTPGWALAPIIATMTASLGLTSTAYDPANRFLPTLYD
jgi:hypothetical protein